MRCKHLLFTVSCLFAGLLLHAQASIPLVIRFQNSRAFHFWIECSINGVNYEIDDNGTVVNIYQPAEDGLVDKDEQIIFWQAGWKGKEGKIKSVYKTELDYWTQGWGAEKEGKIKQIGGLSIDYWSPGWGKEKEGKLKSVGNLRFDYWAPGWGKEKAGKIKQIGTVQLDYWSTGWGKKEGKLKSIQGKDKDVRIMMPVL